MPSTSFSLIVIRSSQIENAMKFYGALGLDFVEEQHGAGPIHYSCEMNGLVMEIYPAKNDSALDSTLIGFSVISLDAALAALRALNHQPKSSPKDAAWGRWVNVVDPDGRTVQITEPLQ